MKALELVWDEGQNSSWGKADGYSAYCFQCVSPSHGFGFMALYGSGAITIASMSKLPGIEDAKREATRAINQHRASERRATK